MSRQRRLTSVCDYPRERLIAWRDGTLQGAQLEVTELHLATCATCRAWLDAMDDVDRILRNAPEPVDDPPLRERIKQQVNASTVPSPATQPSNLRRGTLALTALLTILIVFISLPTALEGGSSFTRWLRPAPPIERANRNEAGGTVISASTATVDAPSLPFGLRLVEGMTVDASETTRSFRSESGLVIQVSASRDGENAIFIPDDPSDASSQIVGVDGRDVFVLFDPGLRGAEPLNVIAFAWAENDVPIQAFVLEQPTGGLTVDAVIEITRALMALDWSAQAR